MAVIAASIMAFAGLTQAKYAGTLFKIPTAIGALCGLQLLVDPERSAKTWNVQSVGLNHVNLSRGCGAFIL